MTEMKISLLVMCTFNHGSKNKYREQTMACCQTWVRETDKTSFFCGNYFDPAFERACTLASDGKCEFIHLKDVGEDYQSASYKQWMGLGWLYQNRKADWYGILGTDNYVCYDRLQTILNRHSLQNPYIVGGFCQMRTLQTKNCELLLGGTGIFLNELSVQKMWNRHYFDSSYEGRVICEEWVRSCRETKNGYEVACDFALTILAQKLNISLVIERGLYVCNHRGSWPYGGTFDVIPSSIAVCHFMERNDILEYHAIKGENDITIQAFLKENDPALRCILNLGPKCTSIALFNCDKTIRTFITSMAPESLIYSFGYETPTNYETYMEEGEAKNISLTHIDFPLHSEEDFELFPSVDLFCIDAKTEEDLHEVLKYKYLIKEYIVLFSSHFLELEEWEVIHQNDGFVVMKKI